MDIGDDVIIAGKIVDKMGKFLIVQTSKGRKQYFLESEIKSYTPKQEEIIEDKRKGN